MGWLGWLLVLVIFILPMGLLCFSVVSTSLEVWKKSQPFADSFFDALYIAMFRHPKKEKTSGKSN